MPDYVAFAAVLIIVTLLLVILLARMFTTLRPYEVGILTILGSYRAKLVPGFHLVSPLGRVVRVDLRPRTEAVAPFATAMSDGNPLPVAAQVEYRVVDAPKAVFTSGDLARSVHGAIKEALATAVAATLPGSLPAQGWTVTAEVRRRATEQASKLGVEIGRVTVSIQGPTGMTEFTAGEQLPHG